MENIEKLWEWACSGNTEKLRNYYENGGSINNRHFAFGESHSLIKNNSNIFFIIFQYQHRFL